LSVSYKYKRSAGSAAGTLTKALLEHLEVGCTACRGGRAAQGEFHAKLDRTYGLRGQAANRQEVERCRCDLLGDRSRVVVARSYAQEVRMRANVGDADLAIGSSSGRIDRNTQERDRIRCGLNSLEDVLVVSGSRDRAATIISTYSA